LALSLRLLLPTFVSQPATSLILTVKESNWHKPYLLGNRWLNILKKVSKIRMFGSNPNEIMSSSPGSPEDPNLQKLERGDEQFL
jgi:hypothetical protein